MRAIREHKNQNQGPFLKGTGIQQSAWSQYETGKRMIPVKAATAIKNLYAVTLDWIYTGDPAGVHPEYVSALNDRADALRAL